MGSVFNGFMWPIIKTHAYQKSLQTIIEALLAPETDSVQIQASEDVYMYSLSGNASPGTCNPRFVDPNSWLTSMLPLMLALIRSRWIIITTASLWKHNYYLWSWGKLLVRPTGTLHISPNFSTIDHALQKIQVRPNQWWICSIRNPDRLLCCH